MDREARQSLGVLAWIVAVLAGMVVGVVMVLAPPAWVIPDRSADAPQRLRVGYSIELPYAGVGLEGRVFGESPDVLRAVLARVGLSEPQWVHLEFGQLIHELLMGRIDLIAAGLFATPERARLIAFSRPTARVQTGLLVTAFNPMGLHSLEDLRDRPQARLAVIRDSVEESQARAAGIDDTRLLKVPDVQSGIAAVRANRAAGFALSAPSLRWAMRVSGAPGGELADPFQAPPIAGAAGRPAYAMRLGDERLQRLDAALADFLGSPVHQRLAQAYSFQPDELPVTSAQAPAQEGHP
jgi:polar amino acid transport system substrate-binding protein